MLRTGVKGVFNPRPQNGRGFWPFWASTNASFCSSVVETDQNKDVDQQLRLYHVETFILLWFKKTFMKAKNTTPQTWLSLYCYARLTFHSCIILQKQAAKKGHNFSIEVSSRTGMLHEIGFVIAERIQCQSHRKGKPIGAKQNHILNIMSSTLHQRACDPCPSSSWRSSWWYAPWLELESSCSYGSDTDVEHPKLHVDPSIHQASSIKDTKNIWYNKDNTSFL